MGSLTGLLGVGFKEHATTALESVGESIVKTFTGIEKSQKRLMLAFEEIEHITEPANAVAPDSQKRASRNSQPQSLGPPRLEQQRLLPRMCERWKGKQHRETCLVVGFRTS